MKFQDTLAAGNKIYGTAATSYLNIVITNKVVLIPKCYVEDDPLFGTDEIKHSDETFKKLMEEYFSPDRAVVSINPLAVNFGGGGMNCITAHRQA